MSKVYYQSQVSTTPAVLDKEFLLQCEVGDHVVVPNGNGNTLYELKPSDVGDVSAHEISSTEVEEGSLLNLVFQDPKEKKNSHGLMLLSSGSLDKVWTFSPSGLTALLLQDEDTISWPDRSKPCRVIAFTDGGGATRILELEYAAAVDPILGSTGSKVLMSFTDLELQSGTFGFCDDDGEHLPVISLPSKAFTQQALKAFTLQSLNDQPAMPTEFDRCVFVEDRDGFWTGRVLSAKRTKTGVYEWCQFPAWLTRKPDLAEKLQPAATERPVVEDKPLLQLLEHNLPPQHFRDATSVELALAVSQSKLIAVDRAEERIEAYDTIILYNRENQAFVIGSATAMESAIPQSKDKVSVNVNWEQGKKRGQVVCWSVDGKRCNRWPTTWVITGMPAVGRGLFDIQVDQPKSSGRGATYPEVGEAVVIFDVTNQYFTVRRVTYVGPPTQGQSVYQFAPIEERAVLRLMSDNYRYRGCFINARVSRKTAR